MARKTEIVGITTIKDDFFIGKENVVLGTIKEITEEEYPVGRDFSGCNGDVTRFEKTYVVHCSFGVIEIHYQQAVSILYKELP